MDFNVTPDVCDDDGSVIDFHTEILYGDIKKIIP